MQRHFSNRGEALAEAAAAKASAGRKPYAKSVWASRSARRYSFVDWRSQAPGAIGRHTPVMKEPKNES